MQVEIQFHSLKLTLVSHNRAMQNIIHLIQKYFHTPLHFFNAFPYHDIPFVCKTHTTKYLCSLQDLNLLLTLFC
jgi:hypothetical protein